MIRITIAVLVVAGAVQADEPVDVAAAALAQGLAAEEAGDAQAMLVAARQVEALGLQGAGNPAPRWRALARGSGVGDKLPPYRGRALGPAFSEGVLPPGAALSTQQVFLAGQKAIVALIPQPSRQLSLTIVGNDHRNICERPMATPRASCSWIPLFTSRVQISVVNRSGVPARYYLVSN